jgi:23S rRNA (guanine745-N1)-methyltransferase
MAFSMVGTRPLPASLDPALRFLQCPHCGGAFRRAAGTVVCERRHAFDVARRGFVNLLGSAPPANADGADMVEARARFLGSGSYAQLAEAIARLAAQATRTADAEATCIVDVGAGPGYYLARVLEVCPGFAGIACDISKFAARRAARCHARAAAVVADATGPLPVRSQGVTLLLSVFAPRNPAEFHRLLHPRGRWLVVTPTAEHLAALRAPLGLLDVEPGKDRRLLDEANADFVLHDEQPLTVELRLDRADALALLGMGPAACHASAELRSARVAALAEPITARASFTLRLLAPR